jgi:polar amino acid transport system substrate-binding protein
MWKHRWVVATALAVVALVAAGCQRQQAQPPAAPAQPAAQVPDLGGRTVRVATDATYQPFEFQDKDKNIVGYDIDLINGICDLAKCKTNIKSTAWDGIFPALQKGDYDAVASGVTITDERKKTMDFTDQYMEVGQVVLVRAEETRISSLSDLADKSVAVQKGTTNADAATAFQKEGKIKAVKQFGTFDLAVKSLLNKDVDAVIIDNTAASGYMGTNPDKLKVAGEKFTHEGLGIVVRKGDTNLLTAFNAALKVLKDNGTLDKLYQKWFVEFKPS